MIYTSVIIPLSHRQLIEPGHKLVSNYRCLPSIELQETLVRIAGPGSIGLWWTAEEAIQAIRFAHTVYNWAWCPCGPLDLDSPSVQHQSNKQTHMEIFFKDPNAAILFKLAWMNG